MPDPQPLPILGWRERVHIPDWHIRGIRAKIDTGARTSAIDVAQIVDVGNGRIRFEVVARTAPTRKTRWIEAMPIRQSVVKPSSGEAQIRPVCLVRVRIGPIEREIEVSLVCRQSMLCRMLIGRTAIEHVALVDPSRTFVVTQDKRGTRQKDST